MKNYKNMKFQLEERLKKLPKRDEVKHNYDCHICKDTTFILNKDGKAYACQCREKVLLNLRLKQSGISNILSGKTFANYMTDSKYLEEAKEKSICYCIKVIKENKYNKSFLLSGKSGAGKSHLAAAIINNLLENNIDCVYLDYIKFITEIRQSKYDSDRYNKIITNYQNCSILCVDDFLKGKIESSDINYLFELVNYRYQKMKPMVITTEKTIEDLFIYDEALASRIVEMCGGINGNIITFKEDNSNYRLRY